MKTAAVKHTFAQSTEKQLEYAKALAAKAGFRFLSDAEVACFGKRKIGGLNRADLSKLIDFMKAKAAKPAPSKRNDADQYDVI